MDIAAELNELKIKKDEAEKRISYLTQRKKNYENLIVEATAKLTAIEQEIFQRENVIFLTAAKQAAESNPEFAKLVLAYSEKLQLEAVAKKTKKKYKYPKPPSE